MSREKDSAFELKVTVKRKKKEKEKEKKKKRSTATRESRDGYRPTSFAGTASESSIRSHPAPALNGGIGQVLVVMFPDLLAVY